MIATKDCRDRVLGRVDELLPALFDLSQDLFAHPEIGLEETYGSESICRFLAREGIDCSRGVAGLPTSFVAEGPRREGPRVGFLVEYDALPGLGHACGHNLIPAAGVGAFLALLSAGDDLHGSAALFGTPAEENAGGKVAMLEHGVFDGLDVAMETHPLHEPGGMVDFEYLAAGRLHLRFHGRAAHSVTGVTSGINALDALVMTYVGVNGLRQRFPDDVNVSCIITNGGEAANTIPDLAEMLYLIRGARWQEVEGIVGQIVRVAEGCAASMGGSVEADMRHNVGAAFQYYTENRPNAALQHIFRENLTRLEIPIATYSAQRSAASSDFCNVTQAVPGMIMSLGLEGTERPPHTPEFARACGSEHAREWIWQAAAVMALSAVDVINRPDVLERVKTDSQRRGRL